MGACLEIPNLLWAQAVMAALCWCLLCLLSLSDLVWKCNNEVHCDRGRVGNGGPREIQTTKHTELMSTNTEPQFSTLLLYQCGTRATQQVQIDISWMFTNRDITYRYTDHRVHKYMCKMKFSWEASALRTFSSPQKEDESKESKKRDQTSKDHKFTAKKMTNQTSK